MFKSVKILERKSNLWKFANAFEHTRCHVDVWSTTFPNDMYTCNHRVKTVVWSISKYDEIVYTKTMIFDVYLIINVCGSVLFYFYNEP